MQTVHNIYDLVVCHIEVLWLFYKVPSSVAGFREMLKFLDIFPNPHKYCNALVRVLYGFLKKENQPTLSELVAEHSTLDACATSLYRYYSVPHIYPFPSAPSDQTLCILSDLIVPFGDWIRVYMFMVI